MRSIIRMTILAVIALLNLSIPVYAAQDDTKVAVIRLISKETQNKVSAKEIVRMVNAVFKEATKHNIDPFLIVSMIKTESTYKPRSTNRSGAKGLMQVIPRWHRDKLRGRNVYDIETNIEVGVKIFADCLEGNDYNLKKASRCYSGGAKNYVVKLKDGYRTTKTADIVYRFENELPLAVISNFENPNEFSISVNTELIPPPLLASTVVDLKRGNAY